MSYSVTLDEQHQLVCIAVTGQITVADRAAGLREVVEQIEAHGIRRVLVDFRFGSTQPASTAVKQWHAAELARQYKAHFGVRLAYVSSSREIDENAVEAMAAAYGYFYERFTNIDKAIAWLADR